MQNGELFELVRQERRTEEKGFILLPTPQASDGPKWHYKISPSMVEKRKKGGHQLMLAHWSVLAVGRTGKSNPEFSSLLMGFPAWHTNVNN
jgi:hypothetical protein